MGHDSLHDAVLRAVLHQAEAPHPAGTIVPLSFRWHDDLRRRQLLKQAH